MHTRTLLLLAAAMTASVRSWGAGPETDTDPIHAETAIDRRDVGPHELWDDAGSGPWIALQGALALRSDGDRKYGAMLLVGIPVDRLVRRVQGARPESPPEETAPARPFVEG